jgi:exopolysaccharide production protein ExoQ
MRESIPKRALGSGPTTVAGAICVVALALSALWYFLDPSLAFVAATCGACAAVGVFLSVTTQLSGFGPRHAAALLIAAFCVMDFAMRQGALDVGALDAQVIAKGAFWMCVLPLSLVVCSKAMLSSPVPRAFLVYASMATISMAWSPLPLYAAGGAVALLSLALLAGACVNLDLPEWDRVLKWLFFVATAMAAASVILYFVAPEYARDYVSAGDGRLRGVTGSPNSLGPIVGIGLIAGFHMLPTGKTRLQRWSLWAALAINSTAMLLTNSRSALIAVIAAVVGAWLLKRFVAVFFALGSLVVVAFAFVSGVAADLMHSAMSLVSRSDDPSEVLSFTGRTDIWMALLPVIADHPVLGYGLGSPRVVVENAYEGPWGQRYGESHNWLLETLVSFGLLGTIVLLVLMTLMVVQLSRSSRQASLEVHSRTALRFLVFLLVAGLMEKGFAGMPNPPTVILALLAALVGSLQLIAEAQAGRATSSHAASSGAGDSSTRPTLPPTRSAP